MLVIITLLLSLIIDWLFGEPKRYHPLIGFGVLANQVERIFNKPYNKFYTRTLGILAISVLLLPAVLIAFFISSLHWFFDIIILALAVGHQSLREHAIAVKNALLENNLGAAQHNVSKMVSRDTQTMNTTQVSKACVESILENGNDAIFASIFWFIIAGAPGVVLHRLSNTLDAMWGYKTPKYIHFGWAAARLDDVLNYIPARLIAISYFLASRNINAIKCWRSQIKYAKSPNAGPVMAAGAGGLNVILGGSAVYNGVIYQGPVLGCGNPPTTSHIDAALQLIFRSLLIWVVTISVFYLV